METFSASLALCAGNSPATGEFPAQRPVTRNFDIFFDLRLNEWLSKAGEAGDLRRYRAHCDVTVMLLAVMNGATKSKIGAHTISLKFVFCFT